jgi:phage shock protein C
MNNSNKKIYRIKNDCIIAGVSSGVAKYFQIDTTLVRLIFVLLAIGGGGGVLLYLILWLIIPIEGENNMKKTEIEKNVNEIKTSKKRNGFWGFVLVILGSAILIDKIIPMVIRWDYVWPGVLIILGLYLIIRK